MADAFRLITFDPAVGVNNYIDDRGTNRPTLGRISIPPGVTAASMDTIVNASGARDRLPTDRFVCPEVGFFTRRLIFYSQAGGSVSVPVANRAGLIAAATVIRGALIADGFEVVCIKLVGERFANIVDDLRPAGFLGLQASPDSSRPVAGGIQPNFYGKAQYASDAIYGTDYVLPYKIQSDVAQAFPSIYGNAIEVLTGIDPVDGINSCPGRDPRTTRRYRVQSLVTENAVVRSQVAEIPSFLHLPAEVLALGEGLAALRHVQCLGYAGENNDRFHKLLP